MESMYPIQYNEEKRALLLKERWIDLSIIVSMIHAWKFIDIRKVPSRENQKMFILLYEWYICCVPFVNDWNKLFLKTAYFSRKMKKLYLSN